MEFTIKVSIDMEQIKEGIGKEIKKQIEEVLQNEIASILQKADIGSPDNARKRFAPIPFEDFGLFEGAVLHAIDDPRITVEVKNMKKRTVIFNGEELKLSAATDKALGLKGKRGAYHWMYEDELLVNRLDRLNREKIKLAAHTAPTEKE
ncbi:hypothetical protein [Thioalkalivibrio sp. HK1]|uniref:hypothetical protein n=1 Tax=Thioalkalivibrio sp. HK1 TaxID=1469245 RepID=UPI000470C6C2|nr:hypothetical protein [Thioalkalivibrio sp. HK1]